MECLSSSNLIEDKVKALSISLTEQINNCLEKDAIIQEKLQCLPCISEGNSDAILSASSLVRIEYTKDLGRHLVATETIEPGKF